MVYTKFKDGYARESTFGTTSIVDTNATTYLFGLIGQETAIHPSPSTSLLFKATGYNAREPVAGDVSKTHFILSGMYPIGMQNGILLESVMGKSTTVDADPIYTHTIVPIDDGAQLPSFTIQHERTGSSSAWATQFLGSKVASLLLTCGWEQKYLISQVNWIAKKANKVGFVLTTDPALPATANTVPYTFGNMSRTIYMTPEFGGATTIDGLKYMEFEISPDLSALFAHSWDTGTYTGRDAYDILEGTMMQYKLTMEFSPTSSDLWDELVATGNTKNMIFKWTRTATDYIQMTLTDCHFTFHGLSTPKFGTELIDQVVVVPERVSFEVKDGIVGSFYGE